MVWEVKQQGQAFNGSPISNSVFYYDKQVTFTDLGITGNELKNPVQKRGRQTKIRVRVEYNKATAITGQVYGPWRYLPGYMMGAYGMNSTPLPLSLIAFNGQFANADDVQLQWITENEINVQSYIVERSLDGVNFVDVGTLSAKGINGTRANYALLDKNVKANLLYYRLKVKEQTGELSYSNIIALSRSKVIKGSIVPNPVQQDGSTILSLYSSTNKTIVQIRFINASGQILSSQKATLNIGRNEIALSTKGLARGVYLVNVSGDGVKESYRVVVE